MNILVIAPHMNILVVAPHPDDEVLGCGGTIKKYSDRGDMVSVCYVTSAYLPDWSQEYLWRKEEEIQKSNSILGISKRIDLKYPAVMLDPIPQKEINKSISKVVSDVQPDCVFIPHRNDINVDHRIVHDAALVALRPPYTRCRQIFVYETLSETEWGTRRSVFDAAYYVDISDTLDHKVLAMEAYKSEIKESPHPRSSDIIRCLARKRGSEINRYAAEAFVPLRIIED